MNKKEAIEIIKKNWPDSRYTMLREALQTLIPELKESDDDRIRKEIIQYLKDYPNLPNGNYCRDDFFAWLEKQGEKTEPIDGFNTEFERQISHLIASTINKEYDYTKDFVKWTSDALLNYAKHELEKQGRQKSQCKSAFELWKDMRFEVYMQASGNRHEPNCSDDSTKMFSINDIDEIFEKVAEKQGEQKPNDKVEPKFKVGDWIVYSRNDSSMEILYVYDIRDGRYYFNDNVHFSWSVKECDEKSHLWTIQDAKDGDVLSTENPFIFSGFGDGKHPNNPTAYCGINTSNTFILSEGNDWWTSGAVHPATEEQHSLLFQKMKEAGYEWDTEKKELMMIDNKQDIVEALRTEYEKGRYDAIAEMKTIEWDEDDERNLKGIIDEIEANKKNAPDYDLETYDRFLSWLKSLKDRVQHQPKQEWSEYDKTQLSEAIQMIEANGAWVRSKDTVKKVSNWLKSLKPNHWKPSDGQMKSLKKSFEIMDNVFDRENIRSIYCALKHFF